MKNILSFSPGTAIKGKVIKEWINYHINNQTSHTKDAMRMKKYLDIDDDSLYTISKGNYMASERSFMVKKVTFIPARHNLKSIFTDI